MLSLGIRVLYKLFLYLKNYSSYYDYRDIILFHISEVFDEQNCTFFFFEYLNPMYERIATMLINGLYQNNTDSFSYLHQ